MRQFVFPALAGILGLAALSPAMASTRNAPVASTLASNLATRQGYVVESNATAIDALEAHRVSSTGRPLRHVLLTGATPIGMVDRDASKLAAASGR